QQVPDLGSLHQVRRGRHLERPGVQPHRRESLRTSAHPVGTKRRNKAVDNIMSSKLFTTRQGTILLGVIAAVVAAIALLVYLNHYRNSVTHPPLQVLVAKKTIPKGTSGDVLAKSTGFYEVAQIPRGQVETGAITDSSTLAGKVALADINPNSQLTASQFGPASGVVTQLGPNERAVVVSLG